MNQNPDSHSVRRIVLPSGRAIEVVRFGSEPTVGDGLHVCPECGSQLVQPVRWREASQGFWELTLGCPNCEWIGTGVFAQERVDELEEQLDEGVRELLDDLRRLTQANMAEQIDQFAAALQTDLILPEDF